MPFEPTAVSTTLSYFVPPGDGSKPCKYIKANPTAGIPQRNFERADEAVQIQNLRGREHLVSLEKNGFHFFRHPTKHMSFANDQEIQDEYYPESADLIKQVTGASRVVFFDHSAH